MRSLKQYFYNPTCFRCGSFFVEDHLFCEPCFDLHIAPRVEIKRRTILQNNKTFEHYYLFDWNPGESDLISGLVYQLKGNRCSIALQYYANLLTQQLLVGRYAISDFEWVIPLPGSKKTSLHSYILAKKVSERLSLPFLDILIKEVSQTSQKTLNVQQRRTLELSLLPAYGPEQITGLRNEMAKVIYVDDILTTGSTFKAAREAVGVQQKACLLTIFYRPVMTTAFEKPATEE